MVTAEDLVELPINPETGREMLVIRQSDFKLWLTDRRDFYLGVVRNLEPIAHKVGVADIGTLVHHGMQAHYTGKDPLAAIAYALNDELNKNPFMSKALLDAGEFARVIMDGYVQWLEDEALDHGLKPLRVEERLSALIGVFAGIEVYVSGAIDLVMQDSADLIWIFDHKTLDTFKTILATLPNDFQGQTYDLLLKSAGVSAAGFVHNQLRRSKRTARATGPFYNRTTVHFNDLQRQRHLWHMQGIAEEIVGRIQVLRQLTPGTPVHTEAVHKFFPPMLTKDSSWKSNFLDVSILMDTDPEAAEDMLATMYQQKEKVA